MELSEFLAHYEQGHLNKYEMTLIAIKRIVEDDVSIYDTLPNWLQAEILNMAKSCLSGNEIIFISSTGAVDKTHLVRELCVLLEDKLNVSEESSE